MKKLALLDFDNVIYKGHSVFDIIQYQEEIGLLDPEVLKKVTAQYKIYKAQEATYTEAAGEALNIWANGLTDITYHESLSSTEEYFSAHPEKFFSWFEKILPELKVNYDIFIVSTNFQFTSECVVERFGLDGYTSSIAEVVSGNFTGRVSKSLAGTKGEVASFFDRYRHEGSLAVGDSENDIDMLELVEIPICFEPNENLKEVAEKNGWVIVDENTMLEKFEALLKS